jgi:hypothetical protein
MALTKITGNEIESSTVISAQSFIVSGISTVGSLSIGNTSVISSNHQLQNIASIDATTTATIESALTNAPITFTDFNATGNSTLGVTSTANLTSQSLSVSGISTFINGPVFIGSATSTGIASQRLQVTGGGYVSGSLGIGTSNPQYKLDVNGTIFGNSTITGTQLISNIATGTAPFAVTSTTQVSNLNVQYLNGYSSDTANTANAIVRRDASGNFSVGTITAAALTVSGDLTVNGTTTTINSTTVTVDDKNIELGSVASPTDVTADGGGITLKGATDKTFNWVSSTAAWTSSEDFNLATGKVYEIAGTTVLSASQVLGKSMPSGSVVGTADTQTLTNKTIAAGSNTISGLTNGNLSGTAGITNANLANYTISGVALGSNLSTLTMGVSGTGLSGSTTYNGSGAATFTVASNATSANTGSAIVARDSNGDFSGRYINSSYFNSSDDVSAGTLTYLMGKFGDNYYRSATAAKVATFISGQTMNISGSSTSCSGNAATASSVDFNNLTNKASGSGTYTTSGDFRAPIFYDSNNTAYYTDPASTSNLSRLNVAGRKFAYSADLDLSALNVNTYYPVTIPIDSGRATTFRIENALNANAPSWSTHGSGFSVYIEWVSNGNGWGTIGVTRRIVDWREAFTNVTIVGGLSQLGNSSEEVIWLRGGGVYHFFADNDVTPTVRTSNYTSPYGQSANTSATVVNSPFNATSGVGPAFPAIYVNGTGTATGDFRAPIFYDSNNTGYYTDPASTSNLNNVQVLTFGVGTAASGTTGEIRATNNVTAYYSDERLKENITTISSALSKLLTLRGVTFNSNEIAEQYGYTDKKEQVGVIAQDVEKVLPQVVVPAPFDIAQDEDGNEYSKSGENYKTVHYDKLVPLLIEAIKELKGEIEELKLKIPV